MKRVVLSVALAAAALAAYAVDFAAYGFTDSGTRSEDGLAYTVLVDRTGNELLFRADAEPAPARIAAMRDLVAAVRAWKGLQLRWVRALNESARLQLTVMPGRLVSGSTELSPALPEGVVFYLTTVTEYDFRVKSGAYVIRLTGLYSTGDELILSIAAAVKDPVNFLTVRDPQYAVRRITEVAVKNAELETALAQLAAAHKAFEELALAEDEAGRKRDEEATLRFEEAMARAQEARDALDLAIKEEFSDRILAVAELDARLMEEFEARADGDEILDLQAQARIEVEEMRAEEAAAAAAEEKARAAAEKAREAEERERERTEAAEAKAREEEERTKVAAALAEQRRAENLRIENAIMAAMNKGLFGGPKPLSQALVDKIVELKTSNPAATKEEVAATLKAAQVKASGKEIAIVFLVKFGEP